PSGANTQPWFFSVVTKPEIKKEIRIQAEVEEKRFYEECASEQTLNDLKPFGTNWQKPHLEEASALIVIFAKNFDYMNDSKKKCYYPKESVGIATGFLLFSLHQLGFATLTHTPQPMTFLNRILDRPFNEKPFLILAIGKAHPDYNAPDLRKIEFEKTCTFM
ncbi:MAG: nitroreductase family protein, partial [Pseudobdellovibrionaceae bacterium]